MNFFYKVSKNPNIQKSILGGGGWGGGGGGGEVGAGGRGVNIMYKCLKWHFYSSRNTNVPSYSEIHA